MKRASLESRIVVISSRMKGSISYDTAKQILNCNSDQKYGKIISNTIAKLFAKYDERFEDFQDLVKAKFEYDCFNQRIIKDLSRDNLYCKLYEAPLNYLEEVFKNRLHKKIAWSLYISPENSFNLAMLFFDELMPGFFQADRNSQVELIKNNLVNEHSIHLLRKHRMRGLLEQAPLRKRSLGGIVDFIDENLERTRNQESFFNLSSEQHIPRWFFQENGMWDDEDKLYMALKYTFEKFIPDFKNSERNEQLFLFKKHVCEYKPDNGQGGFFRWLHDHKLRGLIDSSLFDKKGLVGLMRWFDNKYSVEKKQASFFDESQINYLCSFPTKNMRSHCVLKVL